MPPASPYPFSLVRPICANLAISLLLLSYFLPALPLYHFWMSLLASIFTSLFFFHKPTLYSTSLFLPLHSSFHHLLPQSPSPLYTGLCGRYVGDTHTHTHALFFLGKKLVSSVERDPPHSSLPFLPPPLLGTQSYDDVYLQVKMREAALMFDQFLNRFPNKILQGGAGEQGANMSGYSIVTFSETYIEGVSEKARWALGCSDAVWRCRAAMDQTVSTVGWRYFVQQHWRLKHRLLFIDYFKPRWMYWQRITWIFFLKYNFLYVFF